MYVTLDAGVITKGPKLDTGSINVKGTLVVDIINSTSNYKIKIEVPTNINPITSPTTGTAILSPADFDSFTSQAAARTSISTTTDSFPWPSGYDSAWQEIAASHASLDPRGKTLSGGFSSFGQNEDLPALMYSGGIADIH